MTKRLALFVSIALLLVLPLAGCSSSSPPVSVASAFFKAVKAGDWDTVDTLSGPDVGAFSRPPAEKERIVNALVSKMDFKLGEAAITEQKAEVKFDLTMPDVEKLMTRFVAEALPLAVNAVTTENKTEEQAKVMAEDKFVEILNDPQLPATTYPGVAKLEKTAGGWKVIAVEGVNFEGSPLQSE